MKTFEKILNILSKNLGYTVVFIIAIVFFIGFSDGLLEGIIAAFSAVIAYACGAVLYKELKQGFSSKAPEKAEVSKKTPAKKKPAKKASKKQGK